MDPNDFTREEWHNKLKHVLEEMIPFNRFVGLKADILETNRAVGRLPYKEELIGNWLRPALHGGAISMLADTMGGAAVFSSVEVGAQISTLDLRVDYLRPGEMRDLIAEAKVLRLGSRVAVVTIEVRHENPYCHIADARGVYNIRLKRDQRTST